MGRNAVENLVIRLPERSRSNPHWRLSPWAFRGWNVRSLDAAFCYSPEAREPFVVRAVMEDEFVRAEFADASGTVPEASYVYVDYGEQFRRDHALAFAREAPAAITLASSRWAIEHLARRGGTGYLPRRHMTALAQASTARIAPGSLVLTQSVYLVENRNVTRGWPWF